MRRGLYLLCRALPTLSLAAGLIWIWQTNPFVEPLVARSTTEIRATLDRALARRVTQDWLDTRLAAALTEDDLDRAALLIEIGADQTPPVRPAPVLAARHDDRSAVAARFWARAGACGRCAVDAGMCRSVTAIAACLVPFELTPAGDLNALRHEGWAALTGGEVDRLNAGLAVLGLGATAAVLVSGPASGSVKLGATGLRVARDLGTLGSRFGGELARLARIEVKPAALARYAMGRGPIEAAMDVGRLAGLARVSRAMGDVARHTSPAEALVLLRHVETGEDAVRLARVAESVGPDTRKYLTALGRNRVFRSLVRLSDTAIAAAALLYAAGLQILCILAQLVGGRVLRACTRMLRPA